MEDSYKNYTLILVGVELLCYFTILLFINNLVAFGAMFILCCYIAIVLNKLPPIFLYCIFKLGLILCMGISIDDSINKENITIVYDNGDEYTLQSYILTILYIWFTLINIGTMVIMGKYITYLL